MYTEQAFQEAEKQGYRCVNRILRASTDNGIEIDRDYYYTLSDPEFWKALGVARGWKQHERIAKWIKEEGTSLIIFYPDDTWVAWYHRYVDHVIEHGPVRHQDFFKQFYSVE